MEEGNLLTAVVLRPTNKNLKTIIVQPLLCSDALHLPTKRGGSRPLEAMQRDADCLGKKPPITTSCPWLRARRKFPNHRQKDQVIEFGIMSSGKRSSARRPMTC